MAAAAPFDGLAAAFLQNTVPANPGHTPRRAQTSKSTVGPNKSDPAHASLCLLALAANTKVKRELFPLSPN